MPRVPLTFVQRPPGILYPLAMRPSLLISRPMRSSSRLRPVDLCVMNLLDIVTQLASVLSSNSFGATNRGYLPVRCFLGFNVQSPQSSLQSFIC